MDLLYDIQIAREYEFIFEFCSYNCFISSLFIKETNE